MKYLFISLLLVLFAAACDQPHGVLNNDIDLNPATGGDPAHSFGWAGSEDDGHIQDDILFFGEGDGLPDQVDLSAFLPPIGDQGPYGTCVAWAMGYYQKTGMNAQDAQLSAAQLANPAYQASPKDLFWSIPFEDKGPNCEGTSLEAAYNQLISRGVADLATVPYAELDNCAYLPEDAWTQVATANRLQRFRQIPVELVAIQEKLAEGHFVGFGANVRDGFLNYDGGVLLTNSGGEGGGHAMLAVGYDNGRKAFKIVNSWGSGWGEAGFGWVGYDLFINDFCKYAFVAYNSINPDPVDPINPSASGADLQCEVFYDDFNEDAWDERDRSMVFDVYNAGDQPLPPSAQWDVVYLYYNAYDMDDYGVLLHQRLTDEFGTGSGPYNEGLGTAGNFWFNASLNSQSSLSEQLFGTWATQWDYTMPPISGEYYLVLLADAFNVVGEDNEDDNSWFVTGADGDPIVFDDGVGYVGFASGQAHERSSGLPSLHRSPVNARQPNAYTPQELNGFLRQLKKNGQLKRAVEQFDNHNTPSGKTR